MDRVGVPVLVGGSLTSWISLSRRMLLGVLSTSLHGSSGVGAAGAPSQPGCSSPAASPRPSGSSSSWSGWGQVQVSAPREQHPRIRTPRGWAKGPRGHSDGHLTEPAAQLPAVHGSPAVLWCTARP